MADTTFTEMGQALDAATQLRDSSNSVSSETNSDQSGVSTGTGTSGSEESHPNATPVVTNTGAGDAGSGSQPPKTETTPSGVADGKGTPSGKPDDKDSAERRKYNHWQAAQRIAAKEAKKRRFEEEKQRLQQEREAYADEKGQYHDPNMVKVKDDQLRELEIAQIREAQAEWEREAYEIFSPEDAAVFIQDSKNLSDWLNEREPELCSYINKPYGKHLLKGWMDKIAKNKEAASQWQALNSYEKFRLVDKYYKELEKFGEDYAAGKIDANGQPVGGQTAPQTANNQATNQQQQTQQPPQQTQPVNAPVPNSGRDTNTMPPSNNFALMLQDAMNKRGVSSF